MHEQRAIRNGKRPKTEIPAEMIEFSCIRPDGVKFTRLKPQAAWGAETVDQWKSYIRK